MRVIQSAAGTATLTIPGARASRTHRTAGGTPAPPVKDRPTPAREQCIIKSARLVLEDLHFFLEHLLDAVFGDEDRAHRDPQLMRGFGDPSGLRSR